MFPLYDIVKVGRFPFVTWVLIVLNVYAFAQLSISQNPEQLIESYALIPNTVSLSNPQTLIPFVTSMFLHGGLLHIFSNMWFLHVFGDNVEEKIGRLRYIFLFLFSGIAGAVLQYFFSLSSSVPMLGASAAVSGVLGAYLSYFPHHKIRSVIFWFFIVSLADVPAGLYLIIWFTIQFFQGIASIPTLSGEMGGVAFFAHIGGFAAGFILSKVFIKRPTKSYVEGEVVR